MNNIESNFVPYQIAVDMKSIGFDEPCFAIYGKSEGYLFKIHTDKFDTVDKLHFIKAPTYSQAFRFFREKYGLHYIICKNIQMDGYGYREVILIPYMEENENTIFKTYEEAELECLVKLIDIVKKQNVK